MIAVITLGKHSVSPNLHCGNDEAANKTKLQQYSLLHFIIENILYTYVYILHQSFILLKSLQRMINSNSFAFISLSERFLKRRKKLIITNACDWWVFHWIVSNNLNWIVFCLLHVLAIELVFSYQNRFTASIAEQMLNGINLFHYVNQNHYHHETL